jgi:hypothetical protein
MIRLSAFLALAICFALCSCRRPDYAGTLIDHPGTFECFHRQMVVTVSETTNNDLTYTVSRKQSKVGPARPPLSKGTGWIIYPDTADSLWIYDGSKDVTRIEFSADGGAKFTSSQVVPDLLKRAPPIFLQRLPTEIKGAGSK